MSRKRNLILASILVSLLIFGNSTIFGQDIFEIDDNYYSTKGIKLSAEVNKRSVLLIRSAESLRGQIRIATTDKSKISLAYRKQARANSKSIATDYIDYISVNLKAKPDKMLLELRAPNPAPWEDENEAGLLELELTVPAGFAIDFEATYFSVTATGPLKRIYAPSSLGAFDISGVTVETEIGTKNQRVTLSDLKGSVSVKTTNSTLMATDIAVTDGVAYFRNEGGKIDIDGFSGQLNVKNEFGLISIQRYHLSGDGNRVRSTSGPINIEMIGAADGQLIINNRYEDIRLTIPDSLSAYLSLSVDEEGRIEAESFPFRTDLVEVDRLNLISGSGRVEIVGSIRGEGNISVRGIVSEDF